MVGIFNQLGINETVFIQFIIYIFIFTFMSLYVFQPYVQALEKREEKTKGTEVIAEEIRGKYNEVNSEYQAKAKEVHHKIQEIYQAIKREAAQEYDKIVSDAKKSAAALMEQNNAAIAQAVNSVRGELNKDSKSLSSDIVRKILGK